MKFIPLLIVVFLPALSLADHAPDHSRFEWGLGVAALAHPDYRGSSHSNHRLLPMPYIRYRGERLRVDDGIEGRLFKTPDLLLSLSGNGAPPSSKDNPERAGMAQLDATVELGPSLEYRIHHDNKTALWLELPLRYAFNIQDSFDSLGRVFHPRLAWRRPPAHKYAWKLRASGGPLFADATNHGYYYNVKPGEATATRPAYRADKGYSGMRFDFTYSRRIQQMWFGGFLRFDSLNDSEIEDSPLVTTTSNWTAGVALAWVFGES